MPNFDKPEIPFSFQARQATWDSLKSNPHKIHNVFIIGGGVVGAGILRECLLHHIPDIILVEKKDFASGTSGASSKLIHAGIRYLEQSWKHLKGLRLRLAIKNLGFVLMASRERKILGRLAPHLIKPKSIAFVLGVKDKRSILGVLFGVWFYYLIQLFQGQGFPAPRAAVSKSGIKKLAPDLNPQKIKAVFTFWDSETEDSRLVMELMQWGHQQGGQILNYVEVTDLKYSGSQWEMKLQNKSSGETIDVQSKIVFNAAGPFVDEVRKHIPDEGKENLLDRVAGAHLDVYPALTHRSYYITADDARLIFILNREEDGLQYSRIGTTERTLEPGESSDEPRASQVEIDYLKDLVKEYLVTDVSLEPVHIDAGIRPLARQEDQDPFDKSREHRIVHRNGIYHIVGVKLTDFRRVGAELCRMINWKKLQIPFKHHARSTREKFRKSNTINIYQQITPEDFVNETMILHWEDYTRRRHGLRPTVLAKESPDKLLEIFDHMAKVLHWPRSEFKTPPN